MSEDLTIQIVIHLGRNDGCTKYVRRRAWTMEIAQLVDFLLNTNEDGLPIEAGGHPLGETRPLGIKCEEHQS